MVVYCMFLTYGQVKKYDAHSEKLNVSVGNTSEVIAPFMMTHVHIVSHLVLGNSLRPAYQSVEEKSFVMHCGNLY